MNKKINTLIIASLLFSQTVFANFQSIDPNLFESFHGIRQVFRKIAKCKFDFSCYQKPLGAFTTLASTDQMSAFPTTYNANLTKTIEVGTTSVASITTLSGLTSAANLVTVGTLTSGSLGSGFTTVVVARGGTGSTTLSSNQVLLGNGTGNISQVSGWGTSGQFLTSNGGVLAPTWQSATVNQGDNYIWTGQHKFLIGATTTILVASSTPTNPLVLNTVSYNTPSTQGASSTQFINDGSGNLKSQVPDLLLIASVRATGTVASLVAENLPIGEFLYVVLETTGQSSANTIDIQFNGSETGYFQRGYENFSLVTSDAAAGGGGGTILAATTTPLTLVFNIKNFANANKLYSFSGVGNVTQLSGQGKWVETSNAITKLKFFQAGGAGNGFLVGTVLKVYKSNN